MSMRYYAFEDYGVIIDEQTRQYIWASLDCTGEDVDDGYIADCAGAQYLSSFDGEAIPLNDNGGEFFDGSGESFDGDCVLYFPLNKWPTLFKAPYKSMKDVIAELKHNFGEVLPPDFDYRKNLRHITGAYYG